LNSCYSYGPTHEPYKISKKSKVYQHQYIQKTYEDAKNLIIEADVTIINDSIKILFPEYIKYNTKEYVPTSEYKIPLDKLVGLLRRHSETEILIIGYSDNTGSSDINKKISTQRAEFIKDYFVLNNISKKRIDSWGLGNLSPIADNETPEGRSKNRRVEFVVLYEN
jgi:outer membrane protein OmpA-like peptidoglycan-associated protein